MDSYFSGNQTFLWLSVGVTSCVVGGILYGFRRSNTARRTRRCKFEESKEDQSDEDAATIINRLQEADWNVSASNFLDGITFEDFDDRKLRVYAGEQWFAIQNDIKSLEVVLERFSSAKDIVLLLTKILETYRSVLKLLRPFSKRVLQSDLSKHVVSAEAQSFSHSLCFMASRGSCAEFVAGLAINIPVRNLLHKRLYDDLLKYRGLTKNQLTFFDLQAQMIPDFHKLAESALNQALRLESTSWRKIESSVKVLQESEKLFWDFCMRAVTLADISKSMQRPSYWSDLMLPKAHLDGVLDCQIDMSGRKRACTSVTDLGLKKRPLLEAQGSAPVISRRTKAEDMNIGSTDTKRRESDPISEEYGLEDASKSAEESSEESKEPHLSEDGVLISIEVDEESN